MSEFMRWEDIQQASDAWLVASGAPGSPYDAFRGKFLPLPAWYEEGLDPFSDAYVAQQDRLWRDMVGEEGAYDPFVHEITADSHIDPVIRPGLYSSNTEVAGNHLIALGHIVQRSQVAAGSRVIEYGAGFGQIALTFARLGCEVHTVDIDQVFCDSVRKQADFFGVNLTPHLAEFGFNPGGKFDLIVFYECFHHARNFSTLIPQLFDMLSSGGRVIMAGEPVCREAEGAPWIPFPWGLRLEAEVAAITRIRKWYELGFRQDFLRQIFEDHGFVYHDVPGHITRYADIHEFWKPGDTP
jgi:SAM-dependent methyltransferase